MIWYNFCQLFSVLNKKYTNVVAMVPFRNAEGYIQSKICQYMQFSRVVSGNLFTYFCLAFSPYFWKQSFSPSFPKLDIKSSFTPFFTNIILHYHIITTLSVLHTFKQRQIRAIKILLFSTQWVVSHCSLIINLNSTKPFALIVREQIEAKRSQNEPS